MKIYNLQKVQTPCFILERSSSVPGMVIKMNGYSSESEQTSQLPMTSILTRRSFTNSFDLNFFFLSDSVYHFSYLLNILQVMRSIRDNITEDVLLTEINEIIRLPMYADRIRNDSKGHHVARRR